MSVASGFSAVVVEDVAVVSRINFSRVLALRPLPFATARAGGCLCAVHRSYDTVKASVDAFNAANRWRKQGLAVMPIK